MKTKRFISAFRVAAERAALIMIAAVTILLALQQPQLIAFMQTYWYIGAIVILCYAALTFGEDYLNRRILRLGWLNRRHNYLSSSLKRG